MAAGNHLTHLVRHGEVLNPDHLVYADLDGFGLSDLGRCQAAAAADRLPAQAVIVSSPLQRAMETAAIIADVAGSPVLVDARLTEWRLGRRWAGHAWEELDAAFPGERVAYLEHPERLAFTEESLAEIADRMAEAIRLHRSTTAGALVVVSHQDPIQAARLALTGRPLVDLHLDKPGHAAIVTLHDTGRTDWTELEMWAPPIGEPFPPI
jgi:broad specificity phosphatase PhoE